MNLVIKSICLALLLCCCQGLIYAQNWSDSRWYNGQANLFSGESYQGKIKYDLESDQLLIDLGSTIKSFTALKVESFEFYDEQAATTRTFFTLPYRKSEQYESPAFFELLSEGYLTLLNREIFYQCMVPDPYFMYGGMSSVRVREDVYYFLDANGKVSKFDGLKSSLLDLMKDRAAEVESFIKNNKINLALRSDLIRVVQFYASFHQ